MGLCEIVSVSLVSLDLVLASQIQVPVLSLQESYEVLYLWEEPLTLGSWENRLEQKLSVFYFSCKHVHIHLPKRMILALLQLCAFPSHNLDKTAPCPQLPVEANLYSASHNYTWHYAVADKAFSEHDLDPLAKVTRDVDELVSLFECVNSSAAVQVTPISLNGVLRYLNSPSNGSLFSAAAFLRMRFAVCTFLSVAPFD